MIACGWWWRTSCVRRAAGKYVLVSTVHDLEISSFCRTPCPGIIVPPGGNTPALLPAAPDLPLWFGGQQTVPRLYRHCDPWGTLSTIGLSLGVMLRCIACFARTSFWPSSGCAFWVSITTDFCGGTSYFTRFLFLHAGCYFSPISLTAVCLSLP